MLRIHQYSQEVCTTPYFRFNAKKGIFLNSKSVGICNFAAFRKLFSGTAAAS